MILLNKWLLLFSKFVLFPSAIYFAIFCVVTTPAIFEITTKIYGDRGDTFQHIWNIWFTNKAIFDLHTLPTYTNFIYFPWGITLMGHTLNPANGILAAPFLNFFSLAETYNILTILTFVLGGTNTFLLAHYLSKSYIAGLLAGYIYAFSNNHFAHIPHLELSSIQLIPLFILFLILFLKEQKNLSVFIATFLLVVQFFTSIYYFMYLCMFSLFFIIYDYQFNLKKLLRFILKNKLSISFSVLFATVAILPFVILFILQNLKDPFIGWHPSTTFSNDFFGLFIPGGHSIYKDLTHSFWQHWTGNMAENSSYLGIFSIILLIVTICLRRKIYGTYINHFFIIFLIFTLLSLGPYLHLNGHIIQNLPLAYRWAEIIFPPITLMGVPSRMIVVSLLCIGILTSYGLTSLKDKSYKFKLLTLFFIAMITLEHIPATLNTTPNYIPAYVYKLKTYNYGGVIDLASYNYLNMYYQTIHNKPSDIGFFSRIPSSYESKNEDIYKLMKAQNYKELCINYDYKYIVARNRSTDSQLVASYLDENVVIYDLDKNGYCNN